MKSSIESRPSMSSSTCAAQSVRPVGVKRAAAAAAAAAARMVRSQQCAGPQCADRSIAAERGVAFVKSSALHEAGVSRACACKCLH
eukprot:1419267-Prymnesium_polylepis.1